MEFLLDKWMHPQFSLWQRILRRLIFTGRHPGPLGAVGRLCGRCFGWKLLFGPKVIIDNPQEYIHSILLKRGIYEPAVAIALLSILDQNELFLDIGANIGVHTLIVAYNKKVYVHAFEPVPRLAKRLKQNVKLNHLENFVSIFEVAVGKECGQATLYIATRKDDGSHSLIAGVSAKSIQTLSVPVITIDYHLKTLNCGIPSVIKIDVEGAEAWVLDGAVSTLTNPNPPVVIIETGDRLADRIGESARSVLKRLYDLNYKIFLLKDTLPHILLEVIYPEIPSSVENYIAIPKNSPKFDKILKCFKVKNFHSFVA